MNILVTGSSGFVGKYLVRSLIENNFEVSEADIKFGIDLADINTLKNIKKPEIVIHLAAMVFSPEAFKNPVEYYKNNINSTLNVLELCREHGSKFIFASSYVYGVPLYLPVDEEHPVSHFNPYASGKIICENLCKGYNQNFGVRVVILRPSNIFGFGQDERFLIPSVISQTKNKIINLGDPNPKRDFVFIDDVINAYIKAIEFDNKDFDIFNIAAGVSYSVEEIVNIVEYLLPYKIKVNYSGEVRKNEIQDTLENIEKAKNLLNWQPNVDFISGIKDMLIKYGLT
jgi:nucleoside-diphosphate-sugar epimerase